MAARLRNQSAKVLAPMSCVRVRRGGDDSNVHLFDRLDSVLDSIEEDLVVVDDIALVRLHRWRVINDKEEVDIAACLFGGAGAVVVPVVGIERAVATATV